jgi:hypothetical protein
MACTSTRLMAAPHFAASFPSAIDFAFPANVESGQTRKLYTKCEQVPKTRCHLPRSSPALQAFARFCDYKVQPVAHEHRIEREVMRKLSNLHCEEYVCQTQVCVSNARCVRQVHRHTIDGRPHICSLSTHTYCRKNSLHRSGFTILTKIKIIVTQRARLGVTALIRARRRLASRADQSTAFTLPPSRGS